MNIYLSTTNSIAAALQSGRDRLEATSSSPGLDAQVLLAHLLGAERSWLLAHPEVELAPDRAHSWELALARLERGEALPYLLGEWEFYGLKLRLTPDVLIPRPETELLVETALEWLAAHPERRRAVDVGAGSGCIALALARHCPDLDLCATDISNSALAVARHNLGRYNLAARVSLINCDLLGSLTGPFDLICANLPYIPSARLPGLQVAQREPRLALDGGPDGLDLIRRLLTQSRNRLAPGGLFLAEIDESQEASARALAQKCWPAAGAAVRPDLGGLPRLLVVQT